MNEHHHQRGLISAFSGEPPLIPALPAFASIGIGRTRAYEFMNAGKVRAVKLGRSTMIRSADWRNFIESLPAYAASAA